MGKYFDDIHAGCESQFFNKPAGLEDSGEIAAAREAATDFDGYIALGDALCRQLRYREAIVEFTRAIDEKPDLMEGYRKRAPRYLNTLQVQKAKADFLRCRELGGTPEDVDYRIGLCDYMLGDLESARTIMAETFPHCNDEMGIACIYWHSICSLRLGEKPELMEKWHEDMDVGHHTAYRLFARTLAGSVSLNETLDILDGEEDDMEYVTALYGVCYLLKADGRAGEFDEYIRKLLTRDGFWPCFAFLAAWIDKNGLNE